MSLPLCIIPARTGSKRIANKNMRLLWHRSPFDRALRCCVAAFVDAHIVVTADWIPQDETKMGVDYHCALEPLHSDVCSMVDVVLDVLNTYPGDPDQPVLLVQPTQPLRNPTHLRDALRLLETHPSIASVVETISVDKLYRRENGYLVPLGGAVERDQLGTPTYACDGTFYGFRREFFLTHKTFRDGMHTQTVIIPADESCRLDTPRDWLVAGLLLEHYAG